MRPLVCAVMLVLMLVPVLAVAQPPVAKPAPPPAVPAAKPVPQQVAPPTAAAPTAPGSEQAPTEQYLNAPIYPGAEYLGSYDAGGRGQRFYLFGTTQPFGAIVAYYQSVLKQKGELVFDGPLVHMFDVGRFREEDVAFPPGVTVKSYASGGSPGYLNPKPGAAQTSYPTVIQIVPPPAAVAGKPKR